MSLWNERKTEGNEGHEEAATMRGLRFLLFEVGRFHCTADCQDREPQMSHLNERKTKGNEGNEEMTALRGLRFLRSLLFEIGFSVRTARSPL